jgi:hypothetical protein
MYVGVPSMQNYDWSDHAGHMSTSAFSIDLHMNVLILSDYHTSMVFLTG